MLSSRVWYRLYWKSLLKGEYNAIHKSHGIIYDASPSVNPPSGDMLRGGDQKPFYSFITPSTTNI